MSTQSALSRWSERIVEASWLLALTLIPIYFNLYSARHFEPDKAAMLRSLALIGAAAAIVWLLDRFNQRASNQQSVNGSWWSSLRTTPLFWSAIAYTIIFILTTITSIVPATSLWGSYQRMQGLFTYLSYLTIGILTAFALRTPAQRERLITIGLSASSLVAVYGIMQHYQLDPMPWRGDVVTRVASTLGNSIFVAAYLIMMAPLALYRLLVALIAARTAPTAAQAAAEWRWAIARGLFWLSAVLLIISILKFSIAVRAIDFRYWWLFPGAIVCATAIWWLLTVNRSKPLPRWPLLLVLAYLLGLGIAFAINANTNAQRLVTADVAPKALDWWLWLGLAVIALLAGYGLSLFGRVPAEPSRLGWHFHAAGSGIILTLLLIAIFLSQSRGPWIGLGAGLFLFVSLTLWHGRKRLQAIGNVRGRRLLAQALAAWVTITLAIGGFLIAFNLSDAPFFTQLREVPYLGRMGRLLEVESGTGLVRRLIWVGDEHAGGAIGLITSDPLRLLIGWGPESMFVAFNRFYPPSLANIEARGASPDRSHQAFLDEIVTKGLLGLAAYLWLIGSFVWFCLRQLRQPASWRHHLLIIAILSAITAHLVEGLTGIPIVATLMMFWLLLGLAIAADRIERSQEPVSAPEPVAATKPATRQSTRRGKQRVPMRQPATRRPTASMLGATGLIGLVTAGLIWWLSIQPVYADMRFQLANRELADDSIQNLFMRLNDSIATIRTNPNEDFYYLHLSRTLIDIAGKLRSQGKEIGEAGNPDVDALLRVDGPEAVSAFVQRSSPLSLVAYAEAVLQRAHQLNPLHKDHYSNIARINTLWYTWTGDEQRLHVSLKWYEQAIALAPQDVVLMNERAGILMQLGELATAKGDAERANGFFQQADELLQKSAQLDPNYGDTTIRRGDLARMRGDLDAATAFYVKAIEQSPRQMVNNLNRIAVTLLSRPDLLNQLRIAFTAQAERADQMLAEAQGQPARAAELPALIDQAASLHTAAARLAAQIGYLAGSIESFERAVELQPDNIAISQQYTMILSNTLQYDAALAEARRLLTVLQNNGRTSDAVQVEQLIAAIEQVKK